MLKVQSGFTLIEVLVALFILSIMSFTAISGLNAILRAQSQQVGAAHQLEGLQFTYAWLEQDILEYINRPVLNPNGDELPALMLSSDLQLSQVGVPGIILLVLTRGGISEAANLSALQRVAYTLQDEKLLRYTWPVLDATLASTPHPEVLLNNVTAIRLRYLSETGVYYNNWRDYLGKAAGPQAIEWQITAGRQVTWIFPIIGNAISDEESTITTTQ